MDHVRIDEGVKRGPKTRKGKVTKPAALQDLGTWKIPDGLNAHEVVQQYLTESTTSQIARQYGISRKALTKWLRQQLPNEWKQAQVIRALCTKEDADEGLRTAPDALSLARAREMLRSAQFDLEHLDDDFRPKQEVTMTVSPVLNITLKEPGRIIEHETGQTLEESTRSSAPQLP